MALIPQSEVEAFTGCLQQHFDEFSSYHNLTIHREPKKKYKSKNQDQFAGYGGQQNESNFTLEPQNKTFPALVVTDENNENLNVAGDVKADFPRNTVRVKVEKDAKDYIEAAKIQNAELDWKTYNIASESMVRNFLGLKFYEFELEEIS